MPTLRLALALLFALAAPGEDWPDYRGPDRRGGYLGPAIDPAAFKNPSALWRASVGDAHASITVARGRVFVSGLRDGAQTAAALDADSGETLWSDSWPSKFGGFAGFLRGAVGSGKGPRSTPVWDDGRVYVIGPSGELRCYEDASGRRLWRTNILEDGDAENDMHGVAVSPLIVGDLLVVTAGGKAKRLVLAYDKAGGAQRWSSLSGKNSYVSPTLATLAGMEQIVVVTADRIAGLNPSDGELLWSVEGSSSDAAAQPVFLGADRLLVSDTSGATMLRIERDGDAFKAVPLWKKNTLKNKISSSVYHDGYVFGLDGAILTAIDAETGERAWKSGRFGRGQLLLAGDSLLVLSESGEAVLVVADPTQFQELGRFKALDAETFAAPALAGGRLYVRGGDRVVAYDLSNE